MEVSIHAPYAGSDDCTHAVIDGVRQFQSTPPMQGATLSCVDNVQQEIVSIHAPYAGSDEIHCHTGGGVQVSIHAPYAGSDCDNCFESPGCIAVSIHAPYAGSDHQGYRVRRDHWSFNPRPLCRERRYNLRHLCYYRSFNPRPLCRERRRYTDSAHKDIQSFNPRPLCRERLFR